jgi:hypothetical protein
MLIAAHRNPYPGVCFMIFEDYNRLTTEALIDLLAHETSKFTQLMADKQFSQEYEEMKGTIKFIQDIIESRKGTTITQPDITFTEPDSTV